MVDFSEFQALLQQQLGRNSIITFPSGKHRKTLWSSTLSLSI